MCKMLLTTSRAVDSLKTILGAGTVPVLGELTVPLVPKYLDSFLSTYHFCQNCCYSNRGPDVRRDREEEWGKKTHDPSWSFPLCAI